MKWAEIDENDFKYKIRKFRNNSTIPLEWAKELGEKVREEYSWKNISSIYDDALGELLS